VAIKILSLPSKNDEYFQIMKEIRILQDSTSSPSLVQMIEAYVVGSQLWIVMEYCSVGSLESIIHSQGPFSEAQTAAAIKQILYGLLSLHQNKKIHRDIKPANVLIDKNGLFKLADFGLATMLSSTLGNATSLCGTPYYVSPEVCQQNSYSYKTDVWSLGILMYFLLTGNVPASIRPLSPQELISAIPHYKPSVFELPGKPTPGYKWTQSSEFDLDQLGLRSGQRFPAGQYWSDDAKDFLRCCLQHDISSRWEVAQLLQHRFIFSVPRFVQPPRPPRTDPPIDVHTLPVDPLEIQLLAVEAPKHGAWPTRSSYIAVPKNFPQYLKTDDYGFGAAIRFLGAFPHTTPRTLSEQEINSIYSPIDSIHFYFHGLSSSSPYNNQIKRNQLMAANLIDIINNPLKQQFSDGESLVCLDVIEQNEQKIAIEPLMIAQDGVQPNKRPITTDPTDLTSKQQRIGDLKSPRDVYAISPQSTASGHVKDIQEANNRP
jgi:serine/threonine protein kinase